jgi:hypothetical protein
MPAVPACRLRQVGTHFEGGIVRLCSPLLTNAMQPMQRPKTEASMLALQERFGRQLQVRVSLDHHTQALHETELAVGSKPLPDWTGSTATGSGWRSPDGPAGRRARGTHARATVAD